MPRVTTLRKKATSSLSADQQGQAVTAGACLHDMIAEAAYYKAEARQFAAGWEVSDWLEAEKEICARHGTGPCL